MWARSSACYVGLRSKLTEYAAAPSPTSTWRGTVLNPLSWWPPLTWPLRGPPSPGR